MGMGMNKIAAIVVALLLSACATQPSKEALAMKQYMETQRPLAGTSISWVQYYEGLYNHAVAARFPGEMLLQFNEAIRLAKDLEAGRITQEQFDDRRRDLNARTTMKQERIVAQEQAQRDEQYAAASRQLTATAQLMAANAQRTIQAQAAANAAANARPSPGSGVVGFLKNQSTNGTLRYCNYSNGVVNTINIVDLCPLSTD